jgi:hypothetical protein
MTSKLRIGYPEERCQITDRSDQNEPPKAHPEAQEVLPLCQ